MESQHRLSSFSSLLVSMFEQDEKKAEESKISVNPLISKVASWYEKLRNAMEYREEEVILRSAVERILKRRFLLGGSGKNLAEPLVRELIWARYFPENNISDSDIKKIEERVDCYLQLRHYLLRHKVLKEGVITEWINQLMSSDITYVVSPNKEKETINNFFFQIMKPQVTIQDDSQQTKDVQVFIAVRRAFAKDDIAFLRFHLFQQYFGQLTSERLEHISTHFLEGYREIQLQLHYRRKDTIYRYIRSKTAAFLILEDLLKVYKGSFRQIAEKEEELKKAVYQDCEARYTGISSKVKRGIIRSVIFVLLTKVIVAFAVEGTIENILYGRTFWTSMAINIATPPLLMVATGLSIRTPGKDNSERIFKAIKTLLFEEEPRLGKQLSIWKNPKKKDVKSDIFTLLWFLAFIISFGILIYILNKLNFNIVSQGIFLFFLAVISFLTYRIATTSQTYTYEEKQGLLTPVIDFLFMPIVQVGRRLTEGVSQLNILLFIFDFIIETPFKGLFTFFEQWFVYLHAKREGLD